MRLFNLFAAFLMTASLLPSRAQAQTLMTLHSFAPLSNGTNTDGTLPYDALAVLGGTLFGTTYNGGANSNGTVFSINLNGSNFTILHTFGARTGVLHTNADGGWPVSALVISSNTLYGTTGLAGAAGRGTIFALKTDGTGFTNLHSFSGNNDGSATTAGLVLAGNRLYGAAQSGGVNGSGMIFALNTDGSSYSNLHSFEGLSGNVNNEGAQPLATLVLSGTNLFGTTWNGGTGGAGAVFRINTDGSGYTNLHSFTALVSGTNSDGATPFSAMILSDNVLFGTTRLGGAFGNGTLFRINADGTGFTNFHNFTALNNLTNSDGANPYGRLFLSGNTLYGTASGGGSVSNGTLFVVNTDGTGFQVLYNFSALIGGTNRDGASPVSGILVSNTIYGLAHGGGIGGNGAVFSLFVPPPLALSVSGPNAILVWPTNADGFVLQSTADLTDPVNWSLASPPPVNRNGQFVVTNLMSTGPVFYRLKR